MKAFDIDNPPETFKGFIQSVKKLIEETDVPSDEWYPDALFSVDKWDFGQMIDVDELVNEYGIVREAILNTTIVRHIKQDDIKWYAYVSYFVTPEEDEFLHLVIGDKVSTGAWVTEIFHDDDSQHIGDWDESDPRTDFQNIVIPLRQAIVNQG